MSKKKKFLIAAIVILVLLLIAAFLLLRPTAVTAVEGVTLSPEAGTVTTEGMTYTLVNKTAGDIEFGDEYSIEKKGLFGWRKVIPNSLVQSWNAIAYIVHPDDKGTFDVTWIDLYGPLSSGTYRLVKGVTVNNQDCCIAGEFTIP